MKVSRTQRFSLIGKTGAPNSSVTQNSSGALGDPQPSGGWGRRLVSRATPLLLSLEG